jgi:hypothetical protein
MSDPLKHPSVLGLRELPNGRRAYVTRLAMGTGRLCLVSPGCALSHDDEW